MYDELLKIISERASSYGESLQPPCSPQSLAALRCRVQDELGVSLPDDYATFLGKANGLDWNGLVMYASERSPINGHADRFIEGVVEGNLSHRDLDLMNDYLVFGSDGDALYAFCISDQTFQVITTVGLTVLEQYATFDALLMSALEAHT